MNNKKILGTIWTIFSSTMTAISFINIGNSLGVALLKWNELFDEVIITYRVLRDIFLTPFLFLFDFLPDLPFDSENFRNLAFIFIFLRSVQWQLKLRFPNGFIGHPVFFFTDSLNYMILNPFIYLLIFWGVSLLLGEWFLITLSLVGMFFMVSNIIAPYFNQELFISRKEINKEIEAFNSDRVKVKSNDELMMKGKLLSRRISTTHYHNAFVRVILLIVIIAVVNYFTNDFNIQK